ncbi:hypothetical protein [Stenotrophomonas pavanii]|uniref:hypothetical protein n=1 Tax=Stenotrophomonas pavanii TaxID=487698 RepID=UPI0039C5AF82
MTTDNKTLAVDVLALLRQIADGEGDAQVLAMRARAAVAELIEADEEYDEAWRDMAGRTHTALRREKAGIRRARALARVKGDSA